MLAEIEKPISATKLRKEILMLLKLGLSVADVAGELKLSEASVYKYGSMQLRGTLKARAKAFSTLKNRLKSGDTVLLNKINDANTTIKTNGYEFNKELLIRCSVRDLITKPDEEIAKKTGLPAPVVATQRRIINEMPKLIIFHRQRQKKFKRLYFIR